MNAETDPNIADRLSKVYTGALYDVMRDMDLPAEVLPPTIRPLDPTKRLAGRIFTVRGRIDESLDGHATLLAWTEFLTRAPRDHVIVCQPNDSSISHMGELSAEALQARGVRGYIVDGGCRDTDVILTIGFPVWCRYTTPADIRGRWVCDAFEEPIEIGGVTVNNGDYVLADRDGVIIIPGQHVIAVVKAAEHALRQENLVRNAIREGISPKDAYLQHGKF
jgi:regulator of RNase E activity RraA